MEDVPEEVQAKVEVVTGDVRDAHGMADVMDGCDVVYHLAALVSIPYSYRCPDSYVQTNVTGTLNVLQAARRQGVNRVVHTSTSEVYGSAQSVPIDEDHPLVGQSPYAASKIAADQLALSFYRSFDLPVTVVRPFNTFGPRQSARAVIPTVICQLARGVREIKLGSLYPTRDFSYVDDTAAGFVAAASADTTVGEVVNLGTGHEIAVGDAVARIAKVMGADVEVTQDPQRVRPDRSEVTRLCADHTKMTGLTGWEPRYVGDAGFERGVQQTVDWLTRPRNLARYKADRYNV